ncbi:MAG: helix-turn-helix domain-containing protein [Opitutaceae bacterium]|nr:helix-turn-helix domain-containing protein [Opitutaceae bacterium]
MVTGKIQKIQRYKKELASLEKQVAMQLQAELAALPGQYGFSSMEEFVRALRGLKQRRKGKKAANVVVAQKGRKKRAKITPELKQKVKAAVESGKTGAQVAKLLRISVPSVHNIKKELGLVKKRE